GIFAPDRVDPEPGALIGLNPPVVAWARTPGGVVVPPFGCDAFGAEGGGPPVLPPTPDEGARRHFVVVRGQRLGRKEQQGARGRGARPVTRRARETRRHYRVP